MHPRKKREKERLTHGLPVYLPTLRPTIVQHDGVASATRPESATGTAVLAETGVVVGKKELEFEQRVTAEQAAVFLDEIARGLRSGTLQLSAGEKSVRLNPTSIVKLELEASGDEEKQELALEIKWHVPELRAVADEPGLTVTTPAPPEATPTETE